jgi:integration host factor subunit alpha
VTLAKSHLIDAITSQKGFARKISWEAVETILESTKSAFEFSEDVMISGFGKFCFKEKREHKSRNLATGKNTMVGGQVCGA